MTEEEIAKYAAVKATGICDALPLVWVKTSVGVVEFVDGENVNSVRECLRSACAVCGIPYEKAIPDPVNLDSI